MSLGTAHEQSGDPIKAEQALKQAVALAPAYAYPHWYLGNLYLRNGVTTKLLPSCVSPAEADPELWPQLFNLSWEIYNDDPEGLKNQSGRTRK